MSKVPVIADLELRVRAGEALGIFGAVGSGKTCLLQVCAGIIPYEVFGYLRGLVSVTANGESFVLDESTRHRFYGQAGYVFQNPELGILCPSVRDELCFTMELRGMPAEAMRAAFSEATDLFGIGSLLDRRTESLSGGEKQLVSLLAVTICQPRFLFLDEPTAMLDTDWERQFWDYIRTMRAKRAFSTILTSHKVNEIRALTDRVIHMPEKKESATAMLPVVRRPATLERHPPSSPGNVLLKMRNCEFRYGSHIVFSGIDLDVREGELLFLRGRNGSGKTTLALLAAGLLKPSQGTVLFAGQHAHKSTQLRPSRIGVVLQNPDHQIFWDTIDEELRFGFSFINITPELVSIRLEHLLQRLPFLRVVTTQDPRQLSWGQKKILNILSTIALLAYAETPCLLILDEPDLALDWEFKEVLLDLVLSIVNKGSAVIIVSHGLQYIENLAHRVMILDGQGIEERAPNRAAANA
jgi:energy-coupling factor transport system ATP-binding protein